MSDKKGPSARVSAVGLAFRELRRRLGWTQADLAARARVSRDTIHRLEHGSPVDLSSLTELLGAMGHQVAFTETPRVNAAEMRRRFAHLHEEGD